MADEPTSSDEPTSTGTTKRQEKEKPKHHNKTEGRAPYCQGLGRLSFAINNNTLSLGEVEEALNSGGDRFAGAFWLLLDGFSITTFKSFSVSGSFARPAGVVIQQMPSSPASPNPRARIRFSAFTSRMLSSSSPSRPIPDLGCCALFAVANFTAYQSHF
jgi:hypothetical protein